MDQSHNEFSFGSDQKDSTGNGRPEIPPEVQQKLEEALGKMKNNPSLFGMIGALGTLAKTANQYGITKVTDLNQIKALRDLQSGGSAQKSQQQLTPTNVSHTSNASREKQYAASNQARTISPTFNPDVKGDNNRAKIIIVGILLIGALLFFQFYWNGEIPQEVIDFLNS